MKKLFFKSVAEHITLLGALGNILLAIIKIYGGTLGHSHALIADGIHSLADLITDCVVLFATRFSNQKANIRYPYGYARVETLATAALAILLLVTGLSIMYDAGKSLFRPMSSIPPSSFVIYIAVIALLLKEVLFRFTLHFGKKIKSSLLIANAWHHRSDAAASLVVLIGILGAYWGYLHFDAFAAVIVAFMIIKMGWELTSSSVKELVDVGLDPMTLALIQKSTLTATGVRAIHQLRTRSMGGYILLDMHILVAPYLSVSEGHYIAAKVHRELMHKIPQITDVTIHVDPEDDEEESNFSVIDLPSREKLIPLLQERCSDLLPDIAFKHLGLDYLSKKISITIKLSPRNITDLKSAEKLLITLKERCRDLTYIHKITLSIEIIHAK